MSIVCFSDLLPYQKMFEIIPLFNSFLFSKKGRGLKPSLCMFSIIKPKLLDEADSHTVLLRSLERIDSVTEVLSDDSVLVDAGGNDGLRYNLGPLF